MTKNKIIFWLTLFLLISTFSGFIYLISQDLINYFYPLESRVVFFDVGQGDSILLQTEARQNILIDGGPDNTVVYKLGKYLPFWDRKIDLLVITHPDADHITGLTEVVKRYKIKNVLATGVIHTLPVYTELMQEIKKKNISVVQPKDVDKFIFSNLVLQILWPKYDLWAKVYNNELNDTSVVLKAVFASSSSVLLTGDLTKGKEKELIKLYGSKLSSQVLKVGHHGSKTSTSREFLKIVKPDKAVISVGRDNRYGHPDFRVLKYLWEYKVKVFRTDKLGDIMFIFN